MQSSIVALTCLTIAAAAPGHHGQHHAMARGSNVRLAPAPAAPTKNIAELAIATPQLSTLLAAVKAAGLVDTLAGEGPFTVFAPTNDAFAKIDKDTLNDLFDDTDAMATVLLRHVISGAALKKIHIWPIRNSKSWKTAGGEEIKIYRYSPMMIESSAGKANLIRPDILATNGVVHLVDSVF